MTIYDNFLAKLMPICREHEKNRFGRVLCSSKKTLLNILLGKYEETLRIFETTDPILLGGQLVQYLEFGRLSTKQCQRCVISNCDSSSG